MYLKSEINSKQYIQSKIILCIKFAYIILATLVLLCYQPRHFRYIQQPYMFNRCLILLLPVYQIILVNIVNKYCCKNLLSVTQVGCVFLVPVSKSRKFYKYISVVAIVVFYDIVSAVTLLNTQVEMVKDAAWGCNWVGTPVPFQRSLIFIIASTNKEFTLTAGKFVPVSNKTMLNVRVIINNKECRTV